MSTFAATAAYNTTTRATAAAAATRTASLAASRLAARYAVVASPTASTSYLSPSPASSSRRPFSSSSTSHGVPRAARTAVRSPTEVRDEAIASRFITLVKSEGGLSTEPISLRDLLSQIDRKESFIVQVAEGSSDGPSRYPICKIVDKKMAYEKAKELKNRVKSKASLQKNKKMSIQTTWLVTNNDLAHRVKTIARHFQKRGKGAQVDFEIVTKKAASAHKNRQEKLQLIDQITEQMAAIKPGSADEADEGDAADDDAGLAKGGKAAGGAQQDWKVKMVKEPQWSLDHRVVLLYEAV